MPRKTAWTLAVLIVAVAAIALASWTQALKRTALDETRAILSRVENTTMIAWTSNGIRIEVYRRDYDSDAEWQAAAEAMMKLYPPDPA